MARPRAGRVQDYGIALLSVAAAFAATYATWPALRPTPWAFFFPAVMAAAWFGGLGPSLFATAVAAVLGNIFFVGPFGTLSLDRAGLIPTTTFLVVSVFIGALASARRRAEAFERAERRRFQATMTSIGDAVIATDPDGRVTFMNGVAEGLTGWAADEAHGRPLDEVFVIVNESTHAPVLSPVEKVLETGRIQGLANHTVLIARDGTERPIDDSAAPIRDDAGELAGVVLVFRDISERKAAEADRARLAAIVESSDDAIVGKTLDGVIRFWNSGAERVFGYKAAEAVGKPVTLIVPPERLDEERGILDRLRRGERVEHFETVRMTKAGGRVDISLTVSPIRDAEGHIIGASKVARDVTGRRTAEAERARLAETLSLALDAADLGTWDWDPATDEITLSDRAAAVYGLAPGRTYSREWMRGLLHPDDRERAREEAARAAEAGCEYNIEYRLDRPGGRPAWVSARGRGVYGPGGRLLRMLGVAQDVTARKEAEEALRASEGRHRFLADLAAATQPLTDPADIMAASARRLAEHLDADRCAYAEVEDESTYVITGDHPRGVPSIVGRWSVAAFGAEHHRMMRAEEPYVVDDADADPRIGPADLAAYRATAIRAVICVPLHKDGRFTAAMAVHQKVPRRWTPAEVELVTTVVGRCWEALERARVDRALRESEEQLRRAVNIGTVGVVFARLDGHITDANDAFQRMCGYGRDELRALAHWRSLTPPEFMAVTERAAGELADRGETAPYEKQLIRKDGSRWWGVFAPTRLSGTGQGSECVEFVIDITDRKRAEEELREADRRKDEFLAMLGHELRNPLSAAGNAVALLRMSDDAASVEFARDVIARQMQHLTRLIDDLLDVSRISRGKIELRKEVLDATPILDAAVESVRPLVEERKHTLAVSIDRGNLWVDADPTRLEQVVVNLLNNAAKYSENAGRIGLSARNEEGQVVVRVEDEGAGIAPEKLPQMFELFAQGDRSLARSEGGLGIGLTVVKKLVELHGGTVAARSDGRGKGSEFTIRLPSAQRPAGPKPARATAAASERRQARILVVDDNEDTARGMSRLLKLLGHEVMTAHSGPEALEAARAHRPEFVLLDIGLPGMDGYEVASRLRQDDCCKDAVIVAITGYGQEEDRRRSREAGFDFHLLKPLDHDALLTLLTTAGTGRT